MQDFQVMEKAFFYLANLIKIEFDVEEMSQGEDR